MKVYVVSSEPGRAQKIKLEDREILPTLGANETAVAIQLRELLQAVMENVTPELETECQITLEIAGAIDVRVEAGVKFMVLNVGAQQNKSASMKVVLSTTAKPQNKGGEGSPTPDV